MDNLGLNGKINKVDLKDILGTLYTIFSLQILGSAFAEHLCGEKTV